MKAKKCIMIRWPAIFWPSLRPDSPMPRRTVPNLPRKRWDLSRAKVEEHLGRKALAGTAFLKDVSLQNGVIEVDIATTARTRSYPGVLFRVQDAANYERFYIRPHRSPFYDDVLQYGPTFNGVDSWQLYNGPGLTAAMDVLPDRWNHLKIVVAGTQAQVFWNDTPEPVLVVDDLAHGESAGTIGLVGPMDGTAFFSNLQLRGERRPGCFRPPAPREAMPGLISVWELSEPFGAIGVDFTKYPEEAVAAAAWKPVAADPPRPGRRLQALSAEIQGRGLRPGQDHAAGGERLLAAAELRLQRHRHRLPERPAPSTPATPPTSRATGRSWASSATTTSSSCR